MSNACDGQRSSGHLAVRAWSTTQVGGAMMLRTSWEVNQNGLGCIASERLSFTRLGKAFRGKPRSKPESGNPTFRDCRGARGNVTLSVITWCARLGSIPTRGRHLFNDLQILGSPTSFTSVTSGVSRGRRSRSRTQYLRGFKRWLQI